MILLIVQLLTIHVIAASSGEDNQESKVVLFAEKNNGVIELYEDSEGKDLLDIIQDDTIVELVEEQPTENRHFSLIRYISKIEINDQSTSEEIVEGYVHNTRIVSIIDADEYRKERLENKAGKIESDKLESESTDEQQNEDSESINIDNHEELEGLEHEEEKIKEKDKVTNTQALTVKQSEPLIGLALKHPVSVYVDTNRDSEVLKNYSYGHQLKFRPHSDDWYKATVYIDGKPHSGYIHTSDVGEAENISSVTGVALKQRTSVYSDTSKSSKVLKSYQQGHILKYKAHDKDWFIATVFVNGKAHTGYIHARDVETGIDNQSTLQGVGIKGPTKVYTTASTKSGTLKSFSYGHNLKYRTFTSEWYESTVYIKGQARIGYIYKNDVGSMNTALTGYGQVNPTTVYSGTSKSSAKLKSYAIGTSLKYSPHNKHWFKATVLYNGKWETGYIHAKDVGLNLPVLNGYAYDTPTHVYSNRSKSSTSLKSYPRGSTLKYRVFNKDWYEATVMYGDRKSTRLN